MINVFYCPKQLQNIKPFLPLNRNFKCLKISNAYAPDQLWNWEFLTFLRVLKMTINKIPMHCIKAKITFTARIEKESPFDRFQVISSIAILMVCYDGEAVTNGELRLYILPFEI